MLRILLFFFLFLFLVRGDARASASGACVAPTADEVANAVKSATQAGASVASYSAFPTAPADGVLDLVVRYPFAKGASNGTPPSFYRLVMDAEGKRRLVKRSEITAQTVPEGHALRVTGVVNQGDTELQVSLPSLDGWGWHSGEFLIIGCAEDKPEPIFSSYFRSNLSDKWSFIIACLLVTAAFYTATAFWCHQAEKQMGAAAATRHWTTYLSPVVLSSGPNGQGSVSRLQILFFSVIVFYVLLFYFLRIGVLSDLSLTVLELLGISAIGAAASKATDVNNNRLTWENWTWLVNRHWLPKQGLAALNIAKWGDLVTSDDGFDIYHFQMLIFSFVVGVALFVIGFTGLSTFKVPESILALLGLSQVVYVGGKLVAQPTCGDLNKGVGELRDLETALAKKINDNRPSDPSKPVDAKTIAKDEYAAYDKKLAKVKTFFESVIGPVPAGAKEAPEF